MQRPFFLIVSLTLLVFCFSQGHQGNTIANIRKAWSAPDRLYQQAEQLSQKAGDNETLQARADAVYRQALNEMVTLQPSIEQAHDDSLLFLLYTRKGFIHYYFDSSQAAKQDYLAAFSRRQRLPQLPDSLLFLPYLYTGGIYYGENRFDSALFFYKKAETISDSTHHALPGAERLYNRLGVMQYETGNYREARNYFEKAIALADPSARNLLVNYKINIASILIKLEEYREARAVYESILPYNILTDEIRHNLAIIDLKENNYRDAITELRKVNYTDHKKDLDLFYNYSLAYGGLSEDDSTELYLQRAITENLRQNGHRKNTRNGLILKFQGDRFFKQQQYREAAAQYQLAIRQFDTDFDESATDSNPASFSGVFSYINLFNTLSAKADALEKYYGQQNDISHLKSALTAYQSAFRLADHVERTYNSDEARLFLGRIKHAVHGRPIELSLRLYELTHQKTYLEQAYLFDQGNKASLLALTIREHETDRQASKGNELIDEESVLKMNITRLLIRLADITDSSQLQEMKAEIRDKEILLNKLRERSKEDPLRRNDQEPQIPSIYELQKKLDNNTAILSYHLSDSNLLILLISSNIFEYRLLPADSSFLSQAASFRSSLQISSAGQRYAGQPLAQALYKKLISPVQGKLSPVKRLLIIPDDELHYLPFEALQDENKQYLVERFAVQYQYSTALLGKVERKKWPPGILSFAPFATVDETEPATALSNLPASSEEIAGLAGSGFLDSAATRSRFLQQANHFGIIHLATHATVNNEDPSRSFISFYPGDPASRLYAREIYDLDLDSTRLVVLSACETGTGKLVKGEGLMSLSRAFAAAGCANIVTSLWKCEDRTTAFLTRHLHTYLDKKYSPDMALRQAKLDLLASNEIDPSLKTPNYWAHLVFIGNYEQRQSDSNWWWVAGAIIGGALIYTFITRKKKKL